MIRNSETPTRPRSVSFSRGITEKAKRKTGKIQHLIPGIIIPTHGDNQIIIEKILSLRSLREKRFLRFHFDDYSRFMKDGFVDKAGFGHA